MDTESNTASTATFVIRFCSDNGMPSLSNVLRSSGSTSSRDFFFSITFGAL